VPWFLYYALKQLFPSKKKISFFSLISIIGVSMGVGILLIVQSVMNGFGENIRTQLTKYQGDIVINAYGGIANWQKLQEHLSNHETISGVSPYVDSLSLVQSQSATTFTVMKGVDPNSFSNLLGSSEAQLDINFTELDDYSVLMGIGLAQALNVSEGDMISVFSPNFIENIQYDEVLLPVEFHIQRLVSTGSPKIDEKLLLGNIRSVQELSDFGDKISGINLRLASGQNLDQVEQALIDVVRSFDGSLYLSTWKDLNKDFLFVVEQEKRIISFIIIFIILVASFSIAVALTLNVVRKTREIGLLCAMGAQSWQVMLSFCCQGLIIGLLGSFLGMLFSWVCLENRQLILELYTRLTNSDSNFIGVYDIYTIPVRYMLSDYIGIFILTLLIALGASMVPAIKASRLNPSLALKND
jgi:lipoprotein-releasing system permease protein